MKILLTGGAGFIGKNILEQIGDKYEFLSPAQNELDLLDSKSVYKYLKQNNPEIVLHTANVGGKRNQLGMDNVVQDNLKMFFNLIRGKEYFNQIIVLGSGAEYDKTRIIKNIREEDFSKEAEKRIRTRMESYTLANLVGRLEEVEIDNSYFLCRSGRPIKYTR